MGFDDRYRLSAHALITDAEGRLLFLRPTYLEGRWGLPGGSVDPGESMLDALLRECREELGVDVVVEGFGGLYAQAEFDAHVALFRASLPPGASITLSPEHDAVEWLDPAHLPEVVSAPGALEMLTACLDGDTPTFGTVGRPSGRPGAEGGRDHDA